MATNELTKVCTKCETEKPLAEFGRHKGKEHGNPACKICNAERGREWYAGNREKRSKSLKAYADANAAQLKEYRAGYYQENREKMDAINRDWYRRNPEVRNAVARADYAQNPEGYAKRARRYRQENPEKIAEITRAFREANPELIAAHKRNYKALKRGAEGFHTGNDIKALYALQGGRCAYCRISLGSSWHVDHKRALSKGGSNWPANLQLTCAPCNLSKKDRDAPLRLNELTTA